MVIYPALNVSTCVFVSLFFFFFYNYCNRSFNYDDFVSIDYFAATTFATKVTIINDKGLQRGQDSFESRINPVNIGLQY
jgi:hypothetical protein